MMTQLPTEHATLRIVASPSDVNATGDIFGGWLMAQADIAGSILAVRRIRGRVVTVAVEHFHFIKPVLVGDVVSIYSEIHSLGKSSVTVTVSIYIERKPMHNVLVEKVAQGQFIYVHLDEVGRPRTI
jgi:acyl-CoA thioesterase YciA